MAFKMKGFPFAGKSPMYKKEEKTSMYAKEEKTPMYQKEEKKGRWKKVENKEVKKHPLYNKLPAWAKEAYNKLDEEGKRVALKNKTEDQLLNYLGDYTPEVEGGD